LRGSVSPIVPRLLSPRTGYVRELGWIEWRRVADRSEYRVELLDDRFTVIWNQSVQQASRVRYPSSAPKLEQARFYTIRVSSGRASSDAEHADLGFQLLPPQLLAALDEAEHTLSEAKLSAVQHRWLRGLILRHFQLRSEAAEVLAGRSVVTFDVELAETFRQLGLMEAAAAAWRRVLATSARGSLPRARANALLNRLGLSESETGR
jgi:hypothetical protein